MKLEINKREFIMSREVEVFIGVPCSGKSTYLKENYKKDEVFVVSRDDIRKELLKGTDYVYSDLFLKPVEGDKDSDKYGYITSDGCWSEIKKLDIILREKYKKRVERAVHRVENGQKVVVDSLHLTKKERDDVKTWFRDVADVKFSAVMFDYENNLDTIRSQLTIRASKEDKTIPFSVVELLIKTADPVELGEFSSLKCVDGLEQLKRENAYELENSAKRKKKRNSLSR